MKKFLYLSPRILGVVYILFLSFFAFDVFTIQGSVPPYYIFVAFLIHLIPSIFITFLLLFAWKYEIWGGLFFILLATAFSLYFTPANSIVNTIPILIGTLFLFSGFINQRRRQDYQSSREIL